MCSEAVIMRPEYPRPNWQRDSFLNLNGVWQFAIDREEKFTFEDVVFDRTINVPFAPESTLSGIGETDFLNTVWYKRSVEIPTDWHNKRILLNFQAVDYDATVWVNGRELYYHRGSFTPFTVDLGQQTGNLEIVLRARTLRGKYRPAGKQSPRLNNYGCFYTRTSGIWQTVWLEAVSDCYLLRGKVTAESDGFELTLPLNCNRANWRITAEIGKDGEVFAAAETLANAAFMAKLHLVLPENKRIYWSPENPYLYDITITLYDENNRIADRIKSYGGWRFITIDGYNLYLNGKKLYQKLVLDQGYYPDGIWTAPSDEVLKNDILLAMQAGFNGARLHQKVFEERFLFHADQLGYLIWGEFGDWGVGLEITDRNACEMYPGALAMTGQWIEALQRDYNHPSIIGWCGINEAHQALEDGKPSLDLVSDWVKAVFLAAKAVDSTRPVLDASGYAHRIYESDIYDNHDYRTNAEVAAFIKTFSIPGICDPYCAESNVPWRGQPFFFSEIGGIAWPPEAVQEEAPTDGDGAAFGYGKKPRTEEEFFARFEELMQIMRSDKRFCGYCYTQLTDIFQEINGIYTFDRKSKFNAEKFKAIQDKLSMYEMV